MSRKIYLLRHAQPYEESGIHRCLGITDVPLSNHGIHEAMNLHNWFLEKNIEKIYSSPLKRCLKTAEIIAGGTIPIEVCDDLHEIECGLWENMTFNDIKKKYPIEFEKRGKNIGYYAPPGGKTFYQGALRFDKCMSDIRKKSSGDIVVVAHAGVNRGWICWKNEISMNSVLNIPQPHGGMNIIVDDGKLELLKVGYKPISFLDKQEKMHLLQKYETPDHIIRHMNATAEFLKSLLNQIDINHQIYSEETLIKAAELHDLVRTRKDHAKEGARILKAEGYQEVAELVESHHGLEGWDLNILTSRELLFYADKRVLENQIVTLEERFVQRKRKCSSDVAKRKHDELYRQAKQIEESIEKILGCRRL